jgi:hypothetical protein
LGGHGDAFLLSLLTHLQLHVAEAGSVSDKQRIFNPALPTRLGFQHAAPQTRLALLTGLIDGGGWRRETDGTLGFASQQQGLSEWVCVLLRQTGFTTGRPTKQANGQWQLSPIMRLSEGVGAGGWLRCGGGAGRSKPVQNSGRHAFRILDHMGNAPRPVVAFQIANKSQRFLLADGTITHSTRSSRSRLHSLSSRCYVLMHLC